MTAKQLTPPDRKQCQAEISFYRPFVMGGKVSGRERCEKTPTTIIVEKKPAKDDGLGRGSMALCAECLDVARKQLGATFDERKIRPSARRAR